MNINYYKEENKARKQITKLKKERGRNWDKIHNYEDKLILFKKRDKQINLELKKLLRKLKQLEGGI